MADTAHLMKRFWKSVSVVDSGGGGWGVELDGRPVRTPARMPLAVPTRALADAIAREWADQPEQFEPRDMPLTGLANAAIDRIAPDPLVFADGLARYAETDLTCYRAEEPEDLVGRQAEAWDGLLDWARTRYDIHFEIVTGIMYRPQPGATVERLKAAVRAHGPFHLAGLSPLVTIGGSLVAALAVSLGHVDARSAFAATHVDELWQAQQWGEDALALATRENHRRDFLAAASFLSLLD